MDVPLEILNRYMERRKRDLEMCIRSLEIQNFTALEKVGHQLKGNGETFGYTELSDIGVKMESAAISKDINNLETALKDFSLWLNKNLN